MDMGTLVTALLVALGFFFVGRWLNSLPEPDHNDSETKPDRIEPKTISPAETRSILIPQEKIQWGWKIIIGATLLLLFVVSIDPIFDWADIKWEDGWTSILKLPFTFLFGLAPVVIMIWPIIAIALIVDGIRGYDRG